MKQTLLIDGKMVRVEKGAAVIDAARKLGISIPTLCHHEALKPYGACRLCVVEVTKGGRTRLVTSCNYPSEEGLEVRTDTPAVRRSRRLTLEILIARCPDVPALQEMGRRMGISAARFRLQGSGQCILCGLCVRACDELVGAQAIALGERGIEKKVATPFNSPTTACIGCGSCTYICPTGCIEMMPEGTEMVLRTTGHTLEKCMNNYQCASCDVNNTFVHEMKKAIADFRRER
ncbi:MAG: 2Fe-2S iron-sulfur cluster-binding protein [Deltaproteobacteria bacterium]